MNPALRQIRLSDRPLGICRQCWLLACVVGLCALLASCTNPNEKISVEISGYNHMPKDSYYMPDGSYRIAVGSWFISRFRVFGGSGPNIGPGEGGGGFNCCVEIPARWQPGMKVKVEWVYGTTQTGPLPPLPQEATVDVPDYGNKPGTVNVHFYYNHRVLVVIGPYGIEHPKYKMSEADKFPWHTRKDLIEP